MGEAILKSLLARGLASPGQVMVAEVSPPRRDYLARSYGVACAEQGHDALGAADTVLLAIKPQNLPEVLADLRPALRPGQLVLSIVAGASLATLVQGLKHSSVVRVMPNTPAQIGEGISVWTATPEVTEEQKTAARTILSAMGAEIYVTEEKYLDMATALSGSGPGYVFLFVEALIDAGVHIGLSREMAELLVLQTVAGSAQYAIQSRRHPAELRNMVTSPGGTTTEGLLLLEEGSLRATVIRAVEAAHEKAKALGRPVSHE
ncbi:MAG: pyrroline-5-carboxylate reductase [Chloroflexi bacterium]|nr:pyrroline-5-carboxylate reductase [Chloroflexota bacterium]